EGRAGGAGALPAPVLLLVGHRAHAVGIGQRVAGRQSLALLGGAADRDGAGGRVIDVGHRAGGAAGDALGRAVAVGVAGDDGDGLADLGFGEREGRAGGAADVGAVGLPLVGHRAQAVGVGQRVAGGQNLALLGGAADRDGAGGQIIDVGDRAGGAAGHALGGAVAVGVAGDDGENLGAEGRG